MRSLYWLTAITLVAAAVTTVAIADYGRRHAGSFAAFWNSSKPIAIEETHYPRGYQQVAVSKQVVVPGTQAVVSPVVPIYVPDLPTAPVPIPSYPPLDLPSQNVPGAGQVEKVVERGAEVGMTLPGIPSAPPTLGKPVRIEDVPEHQMLRAAALKNLASVQCEQHLEVPVPTLPPQVAQQPVADEFSFNEKPLQPLYVPLANQPKVVLPPTNVMKEVAKLPWIPGVSKSAAAVDKGIPTTSLQQVPTYQPEPSRGPEVMPGLHATRPVVPNEFNPVQETMQGLAELISLMSPTTYLYMMPMDRNYPKRTTFAETKVACDDKHSTCPATLPECCVLGAACCKAGAACCETASVCKADGSCCKADGACCKNTTTASQATCTSDDVMVRTYSIAEFTTSAGASQEDLIRLITTMVAPDSWQTKNSTIEYFPLGSCLVVRHTSKVQDQVEDLLTQLRSQVLKQKKSPLVSRMPTMRPEFSIELELVPITPRESSTGMPRVITNEPNHCLGDDDFFGMMPLTSTGRLFPVPLMQPRVDASSLVPAGFAVKPNESATFSDGPVQRNVKVKAPEFFPWFLPYAPLPNGPDSCEEDQLKRVGFVNYSDDEVARLFLLECEWEEKE